MGFKERMVLFFIKTKFKLLSLLSKKKAAAAAFEIFTTPRIRNIKELPPVFNTAENLEFSFMNYRVKGYRWNKDGIKKILILHGFESTVVNFAQYVSPLVENGFCVLAFDAPAHGRSTGKTVNALIYKEFIKKIYHDYGPVTNFLCHSFGGLAISLALEEIEHDENFRVVLVAPATETSTAVDDLFRMFDLGRNLRPAFEEYIKEKSGHYSSWFSVKRAAENIRAKVLWVHDRNDDMTPLSDVEPLITKKIPNFEFMITEGLGHRKIYRTPVVIERIIRFFTSNNAD